MSEYLDENISEIDTDELPWLVFKLQNLYYTINSRIVMGILQNTEKITPVASAPDTFRGVFNFRGDVLPLLDLRKVFSLASKDDECKDFNDFIQSKKQDHINYLTELERCLLSNEPFKLALDPHACKLGRWYDGIKKETDSKSTYLKRHLGDLDEPHSKFHLLTADLLSHKKNCVKCKQNECNVKTESLREIKRNCDTVLQVLDDVINEFVNSFREMIVVTSDDSVTLGLIVDEVVAVDKLEILSTAEHFPSFQKVKFFTGIASSAKIDSEILIVNEQFLMGMFEEYNKINN